MIAPEIYINEWGEIYMRYELEGALAVWWSVTVLHHPELPTYHELVPAGGPR